MSATSRTLNQLHFIKSVVSYKYNTTTKFANFINRTLD